MVLPSTVVLSTCNASISRSGAAPSGTATEALALSVCEHLGLALTNIRLRETLRNQSIRDPLTGLFNLRYLEETLAREISRCARSGAPLGLMMMDIDRFKFGHAGGDALLVELGSLLDRVTRVEDAACRYGGDEFVVLLPETGLEVTLARAEEIRRASNLAVAAIAPTLVTGLGFLLYLGLESL